MVGKHNTHLLLVGLAALACAPSAAAPRRPPPAIAIAADEFPVACDPRRLAPGFGALGGMHTARRGALLVPPAAYAAGGAPYDVAFLRRDRDGLTLELRTYREGDTTHPATSRFFTVPPADKVVLVRDLAITIVAATAATLTYRVDRADAPPAEVSAATEEVDNECRRDRQDVDLALPPR